MIYWAKNVILHQEGPKCHFIQIRVENEIFWEQGAEIIKYVFRTKLSNNKHLDQRYKHL